MSSLVKSLVKSLGKTSRTESASSVRSRPNRRQRATLRYVPRRGRRNRRPRTVSNPSWGRSLPAAYASHVRPRFNISSRTATSARVSGCDLVYPIPTSVQADGANIFALIPCNPAYWTGTRIAQFAPAYMNYRPLSITFSYIPQVAVTQAGTVFMGTIWNGASPSSNIQQSLVTSNGGCLTQCYVPCDTVISLGSNLQQNLFTLSGSLNPDTSPFLFLAGIRGSDVIPGYFYVTYTYEFKNPIGQAWDYGRSEVLTGSSIPTESTHPNSSLVLLTQSSVYGPGTTFDLESDGVYYHGSPVEIDPAASVIEFYNQQSAQTAMARYVAHPTPLIDNFLSTSNINAHGSQVSLSQFQRRTTQTGLRIWVEDEGDSLMFMLGTNLDGTYCSPIQGETFALLARSGTTVLIENTIRTDAAFPRIQISKLLLDMSLWNPQVPAEAASSSSA